MSDSDPEPLLAALAKQVRGVRGAAFLAMDGLVIAARGLAPRMGRPLSRRCLHQSAGR